jgi:CheY-like chemotaxis protein
MSVLIVDDDSNIRDMLSLFLSHKGYTVATAANGQEALDTLGQATEMPDLILLDLMMPVMSGVEFRDVQRQDEALAAIPVAVISAAENLQDKAPQLDADTYLAKPIDFAALLETVERHCGRGREQTA